MYQVIYKCNLCGVEKCIYPRYEEGYPSASFNNDINPFRHAKHICKDGSIGELILNGFKKVGE